MLTPRQHNMAKTISLFAFVISSLLVEWATSQIAPFTDTCSVYSSAIWRCLFFFLFFLRLINNLSDSSHLSVGGYSSRCSDSPQGTPFMFNGAGGDRYIVSQWISIGSYDKLRVQFQLRVGDSSYRLAWTCSGPDWANNYPLFQYSTVSGSWNTVSNYGRMSSWQEFDYRISTGGATTMQLRWFQDDIVGESLTIDYALWGIDYIRVTGVNCMNSFIFFL